MISDSLASRSAADLHLGPQIDVHLEHDLGAGEHRRTTALFSCRCGWSTRSVAKLLTIPTSVHAHRRMCPYARPDQLALGGES